MSPAFARGLGDDLFRRLKTGDAAPLLEAGRSAGLDLRLRDDYLNLYAHGCSLLKLEAHARQGPLLVVHRHYLDGETLAGLVPDDPRGDYPKWRLDARSVRAWSAHLPVMLRRAEARAGAEERWEHAVLSTRPQAFVDRQAQVPGIRRRADLVGVLPLAGRPTLVVAELKAGLNNDIQHAGSQLAGYLDVLAPGGRVRGDVARSYAVVAAQLRALGAPAPEPGAIRPGMPALGVLVLCDYNRRSELLARARASAATLAHDLRLVLLDGAVQDPAAADLGPADAWPPLRSGA